MARSYSPDLVDLVANAGVYRLGLDLAGVCIKANLPAGYVAQVFGVSRMAVHTWFRGGTIRPKKRPKVEIFIQLVEEDIKRGLLPCKNLRDAQAYLRDMIGQPIQKVRATQEQD